jgi:hypothetical protein
LALDEVLAERGFERAELPAPRSTGSIARSDARFFDVDRLQPSVSIVREWMGYKDATAWGVALELAASLPGAARMEMALPPALSVLARALSRRVTALGFAMRQKPWHFVGVAFRGGRAVDVITAANDRLVIGAIGELRSTTPHEMRTRLEQWIRPYGISPSAIDILLGERDLASTWRVAYLHDG